jgi:hypothetical protein
LNGIPLWNRDFLIRSNANTFDGVPYGLNMGLNTWPRGRGQHQDGDLPFGEVLLVLEVLVGCDEQLIACLLGRIKQLAIGENCSSLLVGCADGMPNGMAPQWNWRPLVEEDVHADPACVRASTS